jgi:hypothetical protein
MGLRATELVFPVLLSTGLSLVVAIVAAKLLGKLRRYRADDPELIAAPAPSAVPPNA